MSDRFAMGDGGEIEALLTDHYLDSLLGAGRTDGDATAGRGRRIPAELRSAVERLADLPRLHPSFRFEERLALRLGDIAAALRVPVAAGGEDVVVAFDRPADDDPLLAGLLPAPAGDLDERLDRVRPLLIGGALTSAAISLAGAAYVAWRRTRPPVSPMARAVRAVGRGRLA